MKLVTKSSMRRILTFGVLIQLLCLGLFTADSVRAACNISTTSPNFYAWSENVGWTNWHTSNACVTVATTYLMGYVWSENIGWIKLGGTDGPSGSPPQYANDSSTNWGVNRDSGSGALSGYGWSENAGWVNFNPTDGGVTWDSGTGKFDGYAWGENIGWIHFQNSSPAYSVDLEGPLVVELTSFTAQGYSDRVVIAWETASEIDTAGFYLWRSTTKDGTYSKITPSLIPAEGSATSGAAYTYTDTDVTGPQIYYCKLEEVSTSGGRGDHGPVFAAVGNVAVGEVGGTGSIPASKTPEGIGAIGITGTGSHTVTTGKYDSNPTGTPSFTPTGDYWFVNLDNTSGVTKLTLPFTPAQSKDTVYYWNGSVWPACSSQSFSNDTIAVTITSSTNPRLSDLGNLIFALGRESQNIPTLSEWGMILLGLLLLGATVWRIRRQST